MKIRARAPYIFLGTLYLLSALAGFVSPYSYHEQDRSHFYAPPTKPHFQDSTGDWHLRPFVYGMVLADPAEVRYEEERSVPYPVKLFVTGSPYRLLGLFPTRRHLFGVDAPGRIFLLGSDQLGRDVFSRAACASQVSLALSLAAVLLSFGIGLPVGCVAGYYGGKTDSLLTWLTDLVLAIPGLYFILAVRGALPLDTPTLPALALLILVLGVLGWAPVARVVRASTLSLKEREFVLASRASGQSNAGILVRHVAPHLASFTFTQAALTAPFYVLAEVTLSYLGLGVSEPLPSWGNMLTEAHNLTVLRHFWWMLSPGVFLFVTVVAWNWVGNALRDFFDPHSEPL